MKFDLENGYVVKASGEMLVGGRFVAYKDTMKKWEESHEDEKLSENDIKDIIRQVIENTNENAVQITFE